MSLPQGTEVGAFGLIGALMAIFAKLRFVSKADFDIHKKTCESRMGEKIDNLKGTIETLASNINKTHEKTFDRLDIVTKHMGAVEQYMKDH